MYGERERERERNCNTDTGEETILRVQSLSELNKNTGSFRLCDLPSPSHVEHSASDPKITSC